MRANKLDGCPSNSFLTLLICLQCSDNDIGGDGVSRDGMPSAIKILLEATDV